MKTYYMKIRDKYIKEVRDGVKKHEYRLASPDRRAVRVGDNIILISNTDKKSYVRTTVKRITTYRDWKEALEKNWQNDFKNLYSTLEEALKECYRFYPKDEVDKNRCLLDVLKHGVEFDNGAVLHLMYRQPASSLNPKAEELYQKNVFSVMEEVYHKDGERIDLVIFLNGIAIFTFELKCNTSGQNYEDAIRQYKYERDCTTRLLKFKAGCLAHFAMDLNEVYMCTNLKGKSSFFLPFNKGCGYGIHSGKGNPHNENGINVSYMWEDILKKDTVFGFRGFLHAFRSKPNTAVAEN